MEIKIENDGEGNATVWFFEHGTEGFTAADLDRLATLASFEANSMREQTEPNSCTVEHLGWMTEDVIGQIFHMENEIPKEFTNKEVEKFARTVLTLAFRRSDFGNGITPQDMEEYFVDCVELGRIPQEFKDAVEEMETGGR